MFTFTEYIQPVCLPTYGQRLIDGQMGTITGWGNVGYFGEFAFYDSFVIVCTEVGLMATEAGIVLTFCCL